MNTLIVGLGNPILGDDGIGWRVTEQVATWLAQDAHGDNGAPSLSVNAKDIEIEYLSLGGLSLMERLIGYERAIIVDSIQTKGGTIGAVYQFPLDALPDRSAGHTTAAHDTSLQTAIALGRQMGAELPDRVDVVAVEAERVYDFSDELTPAVAAAIPEAAALVLQLLGKSSEKQGVDP